MTFRMKKKRIHIIINPASGTQEPILFLLNKAFRDKPINWSVSITQADQDAYTQACTYREERVDIIAAYGGDGTVVEVAKALYKSSIPLAILPGGSANVLAKDIGVPVNIEKAIESLLVRDDAVVKQVDMAEANKNPILLHVSVGIFADFIEQTSRDLKNILGIGAYGVTSLTLPQIANTASYTFTIDGVTYNKTGVGLHVANSGSLGFANLSFFSEIKMTDGKLDVIFVKDVTVSSFAEFVQNALGKNAKQNQIEHYQGKHIQLSAQADQTVAQDDRIRTDREIDVNVVPNALRVLVPFYNT